MKINKLVYLILLSCSFSSPSQDIDTNYSKLSVKELCSLKIADSLEIESINEEIGLTQQQINEDLGGILDRAFFVLDSMAKGVYKINLSGTIINSTLILFSKPDIQSAPITCKIQEGESVVCKGLADNFFLIEKNGVKGFVLGGNLGFSKQAQRELRVAFSKIEASENQARLIKDTRSRSVSLSQLQGLPWQEIGSAVEKQGVLDLVGKRDSLENILSGKSEHFNLVTKALVIAERKSSLRKKYRNSKYLQTIIDREISLGMTKQMVLDSWGEPDDINRTVGKWGVHEQWIYGRTFLYLENDELTSYQD